MLELTVTLLFAAPLTAAAVIALGMLSGGLQHESSECFAGRLSTTAALTSLAAAVGLLLFSLVKPDTLPPALPLFK